MSLLKNLTVSFLVLQIAFATVINVPADQATIQGAIVAATDFDTVLVQAGTYVENIDFGGKDLVIMSASGPEVTTIDGNQSGSVVLFINAETAAAVLDGFTITNGNGYTGSTVPRFGGGITCRMESSPTLRNLIVINNTALGTGSIGGGIGCSVYSNPIIENTEISNNTSYYGGGIAIYYSNPTLRNVLISDNTATHSGGGLYAEASNPEISRVLIHGNSAIQFGGGIWFHDNCYIILNAVTLADNSSSVSGGAILCTANINLILINSIAWGNTPNEIGTYTTGFATNSITIAYSDIQNGESGLSCDPGEVTWSSGNDSSDPLFVDQANDDYHLAEGSPCIDAGISLFVWQGDTIVDLAPDDYSGNAPDMGAFESQYIVAGTIINVPGDVATIQAGIDSAATGDTVLVLPGTYIENINFNGKNIVVGSLTLTTGDTSYISQTIIDGDSTGTVVTFDSGEDSTAVLCGFTITNGDGGFHGGGIYCLDSSPTIEKLLIQDNVALQTIFMGPPPNGGGVTFFNSQAILRDTKISNNISGTGGGIQCDYSHVLMENLIIENNIALYGTYGAMFAPPGGGGGISFMFSPAVIKNSIIKENSCPLGGGVFMFDSTVVFENVTIARNRATDGGGIAIALCSPLFIDYSCSIYLNKATCGYGSDISSLEYNSDTIKLDTLTILNPTSEQIIIHNSSNSFNIDVQNGYVDQVAADLYVNPSGSDENSGLTPSEPLKTIDYATIKMISTADDPHTVNLSNGYYNAFINGEVFPVMLGNGMTIVGESREGVILDIGGVVNYSWAQTGLNDGIICYGDNAISIHDLTIKNGENGISTSDYGGSLDLYVLNLTIHDNVRGIDFGGGELIVKESVIYNHSEYGLFSGYTESSFIQNVTIYNTFGAYGNDNPAGLFLGRDGIVLNCILWNNYPNEIRCSTGGNNIDLVVTHSDVMGEQNKLNLYNTTLHWLDGNINSDPMFVDTLDGDFTLQATSPCIDAGTDFFVWNNDTLIDINSSDYYGYAPDIGAFESPYLNIEKELNIPHNFSMHQNYPNPFNPTTTIRYDLPQQSDVQITIYDLLGREVTTLISETQDAGYKSVQWNATNDMGQLVSAGVYFYRITSGDHGMTRKMILLK